MTNDSPAPLADSPADLRDVVTHRRAWRNAINTALAFARSEDDKSYWIHERDVFDRTFDSLARLAPAGGPTPPRNS